MSKSSLTLRLCGMALLWSLSVDSLASDKERTFSLDQFGGSLSFGTDYVFRGISNTEEHPQIQGDFNWSHASGLYVGLWASNTHFGGPGNSMETDPYIGFAGAIADSAWSYDVGYWFYHYPGAEFDFDFGELYGILTWASDVWSLSGSLWLSNDYFGNDFFDDTSSVAYHVKATYDFSGWLWSARLGEQTFDEPTGLADQDYVYYDVGVSRTYGNFTLSLRWHDTQGGKADLADPDLADGRLVARVTRTF